jgi:hypothetical protein
MLDVHHSILKALVEHNTYAILGWCISCVPKFEAGIFYFICLLPLSFRVLNVNNIHTSPNHGIDYLSKLIRKRHYIPGTYTHPTRLASFLILRICRVKCEDPCLFTTPERRCSASLRMQQPDPCSLNTVSRSRYDVPPRRWRPVPYPFNTIPEFRYDVSLRGLCSNNFSCGFIFIEMTKIVVGSSNLTQPILLYPTLGPIMLHNICGCMHEKKNFIRSNGVLISQNQAAPHRTVTRFTCNKQFG